MQDTLLNPDLHSACCGSYIFIFIFLKKNHLKEIWPEIATWVILYVCIFKLFYKKLNNQRMYSKIRRELVFIECLPKCFIYYNNSSNTHANHIKYYHASIVDGTQMLSALHCCFIILWKQFDNTDECALPGVPIDILQGIYLNNKKHSKDLY